MKILSMAWSIYDEGLERFRYHCTGGNLVIRNICEYIGRKQESYLFIGCCRMPNIELGHIHIVNTENYVNLKIENASAEDKEKYLKQMTRAFEAAVEQINPDIVNFHGIGVLMQRCIEICINKEIPYVYTDHLFIESKADFKGYDTNIELEKQVYNIPNIKVIAVSSGMKRKILKDFPHILPDDICVIENGTNFLATQEEGDLNSKYDLKNKKVLLCVGTINYRKNQSQIIRAFQMLPSYMQKNIKIIFCGKDSINGELQESIDDVNLKDNLIYAGAVTSGEMNKFYSVADGFIMSSLAEGFSIAALEAIAYGLPVIMFADLEGADELNDEKVACLTEDRSDKALSDAIMKWYQKEWEKEYIVQFSKQFTMEKMAENYLDYYAQRIEENRKYRASGILASE